jgi:hypothetical protein
MPTTLSCGQVLTVMEPNQVRSISSLVEVVENFSSFLLHNVQDETSDTLVIRFDKEGAVDLAVDLYQLVSVLKNRKSS